MSNFRLRSAAFRDTTELAEASFLVLPPHDSLIEGEPPEISSVTPLSYRYASSTSIVLPWASMNFAHLCRGALGGQSQALGPAPVASADPPRVSALTLPMLYAGHVAERRGSLSKGGNRCQSVRICAQGQGFLCPLGHGYHVRSEQKKWWFLLAGAGLALVAQGKSIGFLNRVSQVRILPGAPKWSYSNCDQAGPL